MCDVCVAESVIGAKALGRKIEWKRGISTVHVRAVGESEGPARFQIKREGEPWPTAWTKADDLASVMGWYGFDVQWDLVSPKMQAYVLGKRPLPALADLRLTPREIARLRATRMAAKQRR